MIEVDNKRIMILIVDDVPKNIQVVGTILKKEGYRLAFAKSGKMALDLTRKTRFDLILLDILMPEMDGFEVCERLKSDPATRDIPVMFLTAKTEPEDILKGFEIGAVDYITKPFNSAELLARVRTHLDLKFSRENLGRANRELRTLNATKDKFFSIIAHDLRNPIQNLLLSSEILKIGFGNFEDDKIKDYIERFHRNSKNIAELLRNLLDWSRSQQGKIQCKPHTVDLHLLVNDAILLLKYQADSKGIRVLSDIKEETFVYADKEMIKTVLRNFLSNAVKFTPAGGAVNITASAPAPGQDRELIEVAVEDTGVGISRKDMEKLFRIDTQITTPGTAGEKGTGLGLVLCREFVEKNNGTVQVESTPGKGSRFVFTLPVKPGTAGGDDDQGNLDGICNI